MRRGSRDTVVPNYIPASLLLRRERETVSVLFFFVLVFFRSCGSSFLSFLIFFLLPHAFGGEWAGGGEVGLSGRRAKS